MSITLGLFNPSLGAFGIYPSLSTGEVASSSTFTTKLSLFNVVGGDEYRPLTGIYALDDDVSGWVWDKKRIEDIDTANAFYRTTLGGHAIGLRNGVIDTHWQSGTLYGVEYAGIWNKPTDTSPSWVPQVTSGEFSTYWDNRPLFSDYAYSTSFKLGDIQNGVMTHSLIADAKEESLFVTMYRRMESYLVFQRHEFTHVEEFTGTLSGNTRLATSDDDGNILWDNLDDRSYEFLVKDDVVHLNRDYRITIGYNDWSTVDASGLDEIDTTALESKGTGTADGRFLYTNYFPLATDSVRVYNVTTGEYWTQTDSLDLSGPTDKHFMVDHELGIIMLGGYKAPDLVLLSDLDATSIDIYVYPDNGFDSYPDSGYVNIGSEWIYYGEKGHYGFLNCIRGSLSTVADEHSKGATVADRQHGYGSDEDFSLAYIAVPRVEYEVTDETTVTAVRGDWLNVHPLKNAVTNNILQIYSGEITIGDVVLTIDAENIGGNIYGPLDYGVGVAQLCATVYDEAGNPIPDIPVTIEISDGPGTLNGLSTSISAITNSIGQLCVYYNSPQAGADLERKVLTHGVTSGGDNYVTVADMTGIADVNDVWLFQVLKFDPTLGTIGELVTLGRGAAASPPYGQYKLTVKNVVGQEYKDGYVRFVHPSTAVTYTRQITYVEPDYSTPGNTFVYVEASVPTPSDWEARIIKRDAVEYDEGLFNGVRRIFYKWDTDAQHPITGEAGAFMPVRPTTIVGSGSSSSNPTGIYYESALPQPGSSNIMLAGYVIIAGTQSSFKAYARDPVTNNLIESNKIRLRVSLPDNWVGVDDSGALPIPYGLRLISDEINVGTALGGANFYTVNPAASGINAVSVFISP